MGVDACIFVEFTNLPTEESISALSDALQEKFDIVHAYRDGSRNETCLSRLNDLYEPMFFEKNKDGYLSYNGIPVKPTVYEVHTFARFYASGYKRGPGLKIAGLLLYLLKLPGIIRVWYDGDNVDRVSECTEAMAYELLNYWLTDDRPHVCFSAGNQ